MASALTWVGGGNNSPSNPADWSPNQAPAPGDSLIVHNGTINISHSNLAGDTLQVAADTPGEIVNLDLQGGANITVSGGSGLGEKFAIAAAGSNSVAFANANFVAGSVSVAPHSTLGLSGSLTFIYTLGLNAPGDTITNDGTVHLHDSTITAGRLVGNGTFDISNYHDGHSSNVINSAVGSGLTFNVHGDSFGAGLTINNPNSFSGTVNIANGLAPHSSNPGSTITLAGLTATSYDLRNDMLTLFNANKVVDRLHLNNQSSLSMTVVQGSGAVDVNFGAALLHGQTALPTH